VNWKQLAKAVVDEVKTWANERFADLDKVRALVAAEVREVRDAQGALAKEHATLARDFSRHAAAPAPTATVDGAAITAAVAGWFERNPPPVPKDGTSVKVEDLEPFLQAGLAKWQLEFERNASGVLQRFLEKLRQPKDGEPGKDATPEQIRAAVDAYLAAHPLPELDGAAIAEEMRELAVATTAKWLENHPPAKGEPGPAPSPEAVAAAVAAYLEAHPPRKGDPGEPGPGPTASDVEEGLARWLEAHPIRVPVDGKDASAEQVRAAVDAFMGEHPLPELDAATVTAACLEEVRHAAAAWLKKNPPPGPTPEAIRAAVEAYVKENPPPARGPTPEELAPLVDAWLKAHPPAAGRPGDKGDPGGPPSVEAVAAAVEAYVREHPPAPGKPGDAGKSVTLEEVRPLFDAAFAQWALEFERHASALFEKAVDRIAKPKDGRDGLTVENLGLELEEDGRTLRFVLADGERRHVAAVKLAIPLDRGVFKDNARYERGDVVTFGGSMWIAQKDEPQGRPGNAPDWRLAVKHGRDAKPPRPSP
jgi:AcrR family transcriptional regulator